MPESQDAGAGATIAGVLLAAGQGRRMGRPKALVHARDGSSWLLATRERLLEAGCADVLTVLGAGAEEAAELLRAGSEPSSADGDGVWSIVAERWSDGMGESLREGLREVARHHYAAALIHLVDLPDVGVDVMRRMLDGEAGGGGVDEASLRRAVSADETALRRAVYAGVPGHPVLIGRAHWEPLMASLGGDSGAKAYLQAHGAERVECGDLATGADVDTAAGV